jgi:alkanesulfonate monooxygenase SsuD/methylene tetrahydromethanopterin reductase-like flavin-dependent oxidoreductase (luciferase family)
MLKEEVRKAGKNPERFKIFALTSPAVTDAESASRRFPLTGTIEEVGSDLQRMKEMGVDHVIFNFNFNPEGKNIDKVLDVSKKLAKYAR